MTNLSNPTEKTSTMPVNDILEQLTPKTFNFWLDTDKLPYLDFDFDIIEKGETMCNIQVAVDGLICIKMIYAGVQYGINLMGKKAA